jgi:hypothetical protein
MRSGGAYVSLALGLFVFVWFLWSGNSSLPRIRLEDDVSLPPSQAELCIFFVSCNRTALLEQTVASVEKHLRLFEPRLNVELILVDQVKITSNSLNPIL